MNLPVGLSMMDALAETQQIYAECSSPTSGRITGGRNNRRKNMKIYIGIFIIAALACGSAMADWFNIGPSAVMPGGSWGSQTDLFEGAAVTANSALHSGSLATIDELFLPNTPNFWDRVIFSDGAGGDTEYVEFQTASPITADEFRFLFEPDGAPGGNNLRNTTALRLFASTTPGFVAGDKILDIAGWSQDAEGITGDGTARYGVEVFLDTPVTAQYFRAEMDNGWTSGLGMLEIDAIPEPATMGLLVLAGGAMFGIRRISKR